MAQHMPIDSKYEGETKEETSAVRRIVRDIKNDLKKLRDTEDVGDFESKYTALPEDYLEKGETEAYIKHIDVPESLVWGGKATIEIHFRMSRLSKIYLVA